ncbi:MAG: glyceraldehyde 3-phosphate dehydrogenase NAD-binding domain-containing protein, partial [Cyanobacteria bacterium P01_E01_bin.48]
MDGWLSSICNRTFSANAISSKVTLYPRVGAAPKIFNFSKIGPGLAVSCAREKRRSNKRGKGAVVKIAINGFGRIGRNVVRCLHGRKNSKLELVAINDTGDAKTSAHLLKYDSILGMFEGADIKAENNAIYLDGKRITVVSDR